jgi:Holliday junction DNA helicase RuvB
VEETTRPGDAPPIACASLDRLPAVLTAPEWRALEGRLEWSASRKAFVLREADPASSSGVPSNPSSARSGTGPTEDAPSPGVTNRPGALSEVIGQPRAVESLSLAAKAARERGEALGHVLLTGQPGLGKTSLAAALAREMGGRLHAVLGALLTEPAHAIGLLARLEQNDVLFIDEIHRLPAPVTECLHAAMEDCAVHVVLAERGKTRALRVELPPFTLAGATMEPGELPEAFRARFALRERLEPYPEGDLARIAARAAAKLALEATADACAAVARRARGTPREALRLLARARDVAQVAGSRAIEASHVEEAAERLGIDADGLGGEERQILMALIARGRPVGLEALAAVLGMDAAAIRSIHEPYLLARGYVVRTARGREATAEARFRMARGALPSRPGRWLGPPSLGIRIAGRIRARG